MYPQLCNCKYLANILKEVFEKANVKYILLLVSIEHKSPSQKHDADALNIRIKSIESVNEVVPLNFSICNWHRSAHPFYVLVSREVGPFSIRCTFYCRSLQRKVSCYGQLNALKTSILGA